MEHPLRKFKVKKNPGTVDWLDRKTVYEGKLISMTSRVVRLFAPDPQDKHPHVDVSYDWVTPVK